MRRRPRPALIPSHPLSRYVKRRFAPDARPERPEAEMLAAESYWSARPISPEEAAALLGRRRMCNYHGQFYRYDGFGIWASSWNGGRERVRTYMTPMKPCRTWPRPCHIRLQRRRACA